MHSDVEYSQLGSASAHHQYGGVHSSSGLARSLTFSFGGRWGLCSPGASTTAGGHSRDHFTSITSYHTSLGGLWGGGWHNRYWLCNRYGRNVEYLRPMANFSSGYPSAIPGCSVLTSGWAYCSSSGAMIGFLFYFPAFDTVYVSFYLVSKFCSLLNSLQFWLLCTNLFDLKSLCLCMVWIDWLHEFSELWCVDHMLWISMQWLEEKEHELGAWLKMLVGLTGKL